MNTIGFAAPVVAIPDAGALRQQIEQNMGQSIPQKLPGKIPAEPSALPSQSGVIVTVKLFRFAGNTLISSDKLASVVAGYLNRPLDFTQLQEATAAIARIYREAGWIVRAYLPQQDMVDGVVTIQIVEAVFGGAHIQGNPPSRINSEQVLNIFTAQQKVGTILSANALDRALLLADDLPGVSVAGALRKGAQPHQTDVELKLGDEPLVTGDVGADNTGARATGSQRLTANLNLNSALKHGDLITANALHTQGSDYLRLDANLPVGSNGWRTGLNASQLSYKLVSPEFASLNANGTSSRLGWEANYPVIRSRLENLYLDINADHKTFDNKAQGATSSNYLADTLTLGLQGNLFDNLAGGGANSASVSIESGNLNLNGSPNQIQDAISTGTAGNYTVLHYAVSRQQVITDSVSFFTALSGQYASKNLDSSEKFYLGGSNGVRAYPVNEGGGSSGDMLNLEVRKRLPQGFYLTGFYDYGRITINTSNNFTGASPLNSYSLAGAGASLSWQSGHGVTLKSTYAHRIGNNPNPTATGNDQDGSLLKNRFWFTANLTF